MFIGSFLQWLMQNRRLNLVLLIAFYLISVLPHEILGDIIAKIFKSLTRDQYNTTILIISILLAIALSYLIWKSHSRLENSKVLIFYTFSTIVFAGIAFRVLFTLNIEFVHFIQYCVFVLLCFPLTKSYSKSLIWATLAGILDEIYQYVCLAPQRTDYFDFNDVILNMIGAGIGLVLINSANPDHIKFNWKGYLKSSQFIVVSLFIFSIIASLIIGWISLHPSDGALLVLIKESNPGFWTKVYPNVIFHVVKPVEGCMIIAGLLAFYSRIEHS